MSALEYLEEIGLLCPIGVRPWRRRLDVEPVAADLNRRADAVLANRSDQKQSVDFEALLALIGEARNLLDETSRLGAGPGSGDPAWTRH